MQADSEPLPKCLLEVGGETLLERLCANLRVNQFSKLVIVTGYMAEAIEEAAHQCGDGLVIETVHNPDYASTNNVYSLWLARERVEGSFLLVESDLLFGPALIANARTPDCAVVSERLPWMNGTTVDIINAGGESLRFQLASNETSCGTHKTVNVYCFSPSSWQRIAKRLDQHIAQGNVNDFYEVVLASMLDAGELHLAAVVYPRHAWYEIDTTDDLGAAQALLQSKPEAFSHG